MGGHRKMGRKLENVRESSNNKLIWKLGEKAVFHGGILALRLLDGHIKHAKTIIYCSNRQEIHKTRHSHPVSALSPNLLLSYVYAMIYLVPQPFEYFTFIVLNARLDPRKDQI